MFQSRRSEAFPEIRGNRNQFENVEECSKLPLASQLEIPYCSYCSSVLNKLKIGIIVFGTNQSGQSCKHICARMIARLPRTMCTGLARASRPVRMQKECCKQLTKQTEPNVFKVVDTSIV